MAQLENFLPLAKSKVFRELPCYLLGALSLASVKCVMDANPFNELIFHRTDNKADGGSQLAVDSCLP